MRSLWPALTLLPSTAALRPLFSAAGNDMSRIMRAKEHMPPLFVPTPLLESPKLSEELGTKVLLKMDALQPSGSFKDRGMAVLCSELKFQGVTRFISSSGGNAGHSAAFMGKYLGVPVLVVVPKTTKAIMLDKIRLQGADVRVVGENWNEADAHARQLVDESGGYAAYIPPYENPLLWEGHSTIVDEILEVNPRTGAIFVSVGGGGLLNGVLEGLERLRAQDTMIYACETIGCDSFRVSWESQELRRLEAITSIATSLGALEVSPVALERAKKHGRVRSHVVSDIAAVEACEAILDDRRVLVEPACGAALAAAVGRDAVPKSELQSMESIVVVVCGGSAISKEILDGFKNTLK